MAPKSKTRFTRKFSRALHKHKYVKLISRYFDALFCAASVAITITTNITTNTTPDPISTPMALPAKLQQTFLPSELFFLAEDSMISILPRQNLSPVDLIGVSRRDE